MWANSSGEEEGRSEAHTDAWVRDRVAMVGGREALSRHMQVSISIDAQFQSLLTTTGFMLTRHSTSSGGMESNK